MADKGKKMHFNATWSMAVGGMVGGGIFSVLGVILERAGRWAWLSFLLAGLIALVSAYSYSQLSLRYKKSGGAFRFLVEIDREGIAGSLSWVLVLGYILTISVYAFTFGHYVSHVLNWGSWLPRLLGFTVIATLALVNLRGVSDSSRVEIITVWGKLFVLLGLAVFGLAAWDPERLTTAAEPKSLGAAVVGAATIFMAYEGFQLLSYDYEDIYNPSKTLPRATLTAVLAVIAIYIMVSFGSVMLVGQDVLIKQKEVALSIAGKQALGFAGVILVTVAAAFSTGSAINATMFSTARLMETVAKKRDLPRFFARENKASIPYYSIIVVGGLAALLSTIGSLNALVDAASLIFLITFGTVNWIAFIRKIRFRIFSLLGAAACLVAMIFSAYVQFKEQPVPLFVILGLIAFALFARPLILNRNQKLKNR